jgi:predicted Zn-dependent protease
VCRDRRLTIRGLIHPDLLQGVAMKPTLIITALLAASLVACQANPVSGRKQLALVSEEQAQSASAQAYTETLSEAQKQGKLSTDAALNSRVKRITDRLIAEAGNMYPPSRELAMVGRGDRRSHPQRLVHARRQDGDLHRHHQQAEASPTTKSPRSWATKSPMPCSGTAASACRAPSPCRAACSSAPSSPAATSASLAPVADIALTLPHSRAGETEADRYGLELAARAGFDPRAAVRLWEKMNAASSNGVPQFLSTHPSPDNRMQALNALMPQMMPIYEKAR